MTQVVSKYEAETLLSFYGKNIREFEQAEPSKLTLEQIHEVMKLASTLIKILQDILAEGYLYVYDFIENEINALTRLESIVNKCLPYFEGKSERALFFLYPEKIEFNLGETDYSGSFDLDDYIKKIDAESEQEIDLAGCFYDDEVLKEKWRERCNVISNELLNYLKWIVQGVKINPAVTPVFLFRDAILLYFGYVELIKQGVTLPPPEYLLLNRKLMNLHLGSEELYEQIAGDYVYRAIHIHQPEEMNAYRLGLHEVFERNIESANPFLALVSQFLHDLDLKNPPLFIDTGIVGTFPLLLLAANKNVGDFSLFCTFPWLTKIYDKNIYSHNYNYLMDFENLIISDKLFNVASVSEGRLRVKETQNKRSRQLALYELRNFKLKARHLVAEFL
jgi:hypothetical protein